MSNSDYLAGQQSVNSLRLWDEQQNRRVTRRASEWQAYAAELEARIQQIRMDRDAAIGEWQRYTQGLADKLKQTEAELHKALQRQAAVLDQLDGRNQKP